MTTNQSLEGDRTRDTSPRVFITGLLENVAKSGAGCRLHKAPKSAGKKGIPGTGLGTEELIPVIEALLREQGARDLEELKLNGKSEALIDDLIETTKE